MQRALWAWLLLCLLGTPMLGQWHALAHGAHGGAVHAAVADEHGEEDFAGIDSEASHNCAAYDALTTATALQATWQAAAPWLQWLRVSCPSAAQARFLPPPLYYPARAPPVFS